MATARRIKEQILDQADRDCAIRTLQWLHSTGWGHRPMPSEEQIAAFIEAMHKNPKIVPSFDPDDP